MAGQQGLALAPDEIVEELAESGAVG